MNFWFHFIFSSPFRKIFDLIFQLKGKKPAACAQQIKDFSLKNFLFFLSHLITIKKSSQINEYVRMGLKLRRGKKRTKLFPSLFLFLLLLWIQMNINGWLPNDSQSCLCVQMETFVCLPMPTQNEKGSGSEKERKRSFSLHLLTVACSSWIINKETHFVALRFIKSLPPIYSTTVCCACKFRDGWETFFFWKEETEIGWKMLSRMDGVSLVIFVAVLLTL